MNTNHFTALQMAGTKLLSTAKQKHILQKEMSDITSIYWYARAAKT